ncbi:MAG: AAA family ATPase [Desulfosarcinaceae bacterium]
MDYYRLLQLEREPFSNSPDPEYFFQSQQHRGCLQKLELALRLKRGLNVILGDVGTGKTTLCRELIRKLGGEEQFETHLILDPGEETPKAFLLAIADMICPAPLERQLSESEIKEQIKRILFEKGVNQGKTVILIIDEGQKIAPANVEILRELLNYETNDYKLLQIVLFAQQEFSETLDQQANFADRVNLLYRLSPMSFRDSCRMIRHRLKLASRSPKPLNLFTRPGLWAIYLASRGYPRRIIHICHQGMLAMIIQNKTHAGWATIRSWAILKTCAVCGLPLIWIPCGVKSTTKAITAPAAPAISQCRDPALSLRGWRCHRPASDPD